MDPHPAHGPPSPAVCPRFKNGQGSGLDGGHYRVYINGTLEIKRARAEDEGTYTCVASNIMGTVDNQVVLEVKGQTPGGRSPEGRGGLLLCVVRPAAQNRDLLCSTSP